MTPKQKERHRLAIHEAGHATAALLMGRRWGAALFEDGSGVSGAGELAEPLPAMPPERAAEIYEGIDVREVFEDAVLTAAGHVAERLDEHAAFIGPMRYGGGDHIMMIEACRRVLPASDDACEAAFIELAARSARRLLGMHLDSIRAVADAIDRKGRLTAAEVEEIHNNTTQKNERTEDDENQKTLPGMPGELGTQGR